MQESAQSTLVDIESFLLKTITHPTFKDLRDHQDWFDDFEPELDDHIRFSDEKYKRVILLEHPAFDLLVIGWKPGQGTGVHDHPAQGCLFKVIQGSLNEQYYKSDEKPELRLHIPGKSVFLSSQDCKHAMINDGVTNAVTLHLYAPGQYDPD